MTEVTYDLHVALGAQFAAVLEAAQHGDETAFATIYRDLAGVVAGYVRGKGAREPDDVVSETFIAVARNIKRFEGDEAKFRSWVFTIAHRRLIDERRARGRRRDTPQDPSTMRAPPTASSETAAIAALGDEATALLEHLTPDQREVVLLRVVAGMSVKETAHVLGRSESNVKVLQHRAVNALAGRFAAAGVTDRAGAAMTDPS